MSSNPPCCIVVEANATPLDPLPRITARAPPTNHMGSLLTSWAIYASLACYLLAVVNLLTRNRGSRCYRALWTAGCLLLWAHAGFAFHFYHHWSHAAAVQATARETREILGWQFGAGIWFNYALFAAWSVDVSRLWWSREFTVQPWSPFSTAVHVYAFLILFNGTVVFEHGPTRWLSIAATTWLLWLIWLRWQCTNVD